MPFVFPSRATAEGKKHHAPPLLVPDAARVSRPPPRRIRPPAARARTRRRCGRETAARCSFLSLLSPKFLPLPLYPQMSLYPQNMWIGPSPAPSWPSMPPAHSPRRSPTRRHYASRPTPVGPRWAHRLCQRELYAVIPRLPRRRRHARPSTRFRPTARRPLPRACHPLPPHATPLAAACAPPPPRHRRPPPGTRPDGAAAATSTRSTRPRVRIPFLGNHHFIIL